MPNSPTVSILVLNCNGRAHLETCLPTVDAQVYPKERVRIEVIDNGSTDGSLELLRDRFPRVVVHAFDRNRGFAPAYDDVARGSDSDFLVFLNNDTKVEPTWLAELIAASERTGAHAVASRILDWNGERIDFVGGLVSFIGHSWQRCTGEPAAASGTEDERLLFACGGSMLISREAYMDAGGFDRDFFAYFEDVDLGWRLALLGYDTVLASRAVTYHRLHGTAGRVAFAQRLRLYERNALAMLYKNYEDETLRRVLPSAIALSLLRGLAHSGIDPRTFAVGAPQVPVLDVTARTLVHLFALEDFGQQLPELNRKRREIQQRRRRSDRDLFPLFGDPFRLHEGGAYEAVARAFIRDFDLEPLFAGEAPTPATSGAIGGASPDEPVTISVRPSTVSVIVLTVLGQPHLADCLSSLRAQTYPGEQIEILVVDNESPVDPAPLVEQYYPGARVVRVGKNAGFSGGNNVGARAATGEYLVFLNDDTRVHPDWLRELVETAQRRRAASVGSRILSWDGSLIDFVGGSVNCEGKGFQIDIGQPEAGRHGEERPLLFACGGAMLVRRDVFLESGGWDEGAFAYYEDVELGWRLWLLGHEVWFSPRSIVYHKHHGTWGKWPEPPRLRLYERNSLRILYTHLERETLERLLPTALLLATDRVLLATDLSRASLGVLEQPASERREGRPRASLRRLAHRAKSALAGRGVTRTRTILQNLGHLGIRGLAGAARDVAHEAAAIPFVSGRAVYQIERGAVTTSLDGRTEPIPTGAAAALCGIHDFLLDVPRLSERRRLLQSRRRRTDRDIISRFDVHWLSPCGAPRQIEHEELNRAIIDSFGVAELSRAWHAPRS